MPIMTQTVKGIPLDWEAWCEQDKKAFREQLRLLVSQKRGPSGQGKGALIEEWQPWLLHYFPSYFRSPDGLPIPFAPFHEEMWEWIWSLERGTRPPPFIAIWSRGAGKSTAAELACVAVGARQSRKYVLYICHEKGTPIFDPALGVWMPVEEHPTAREHQAQGIEIAVCGLPFRENVTLQHQYWARRIARRSRGHETGNEVFKGAPHWIEAQHLDWNTWIGLPIDDTISTDFPSLAEWQRHAKTFEQIVPPEFSDPEWWWFFGLWWGDGTLGGTGNVQICVSLGDKYPETKERVIALLEKWHYAWNNVPSQQGACSSLSFCSSVLGRWLQTWRVGKSRKEPPAWVERLPLDMQALLMRGYFDADGYEDDRWITLTSIHLPGLLAVRRILARLGIPSQIGKRRTPTPAVFRGYEYVTQQSYTLRIAENAERLGYELDRNNDWQVQDIFIADGQLWSRVKEMTPTEEKTFVPITTESETYHTAFGLSHNCSTQEQADTHVTNVSQMLESPTLALRYPSLATRKLNKYGRPLGWRRNRLQTASRLTVDALGFDVALRGLRIDEDRPDLIILDDVDSLKDSAHMVERKKEQLTKSIIPSGSADLAVLGVQNLVHDASIFSQLADGSADFLAKKHISGPHPALRDLRFERNKEGVTRLTAGTPTWEGMDLSRCQAMVDDMGFSAFMAECQHERQYLHGKMFADVWHPSIHMIEPFPIPRHWTIDRTHDWGSSAPFATLWFAESNGEEVELPSGIIMHWPKGTIFVINEDYGFNGKPNQGLRLTNIAIAERVKAKEALLDMPGRIRPGAADSMIFDVINGRSIADDYASVGVRFLRAEKGPGSRVTGWKMIHDRLVASTKSPMENPGLFVFTTCPQTARIIPLMPRDPKDPDDVDDSSESHIGDCLRYRLLQMRHTFAKGPLKGF